MPRRARLTMPGILWHIIQRGNDRFKPRKIISFIRRILEGNNIEIGEFYKS